jgi:solute carrier family 8 (sodium/calcium exchanger)
MLGPQFDEDNMVLEDVSLFEALNHFSTIFWKILFAIVPPINMCNGKPAFVVSLAFIGLVTGVVGEIATVLGCALGIQ